MMWAIIALGIIFIWHLIFANKQCDHLRQINKELGDVNAKLQSDLNQANKDFEKLLIEFRDYKENIK